MSSLIPPSPSRRRRYEALKQISWTLDNAENRVAQFDTPGTDETASEDDMIVEYELVDDQNYIAYQELEEDEDMQMTREIKDDDVDMQLTQEITYNKPVKDAVIQETTTTKDKPSLEDSEQTTLADFLEMAGITFPRQIPLNDIVPISIVDVDYESPTIAEQAAAAAFTLPQIDMYDSISKEIHSLIDTSQDVIQKVEDRVNRTSTEFFSDYLRANASTRITMEPEYRLTKQYAELKSLERWYEWCVNIFVEHFGTLKGHINTLTQDRQTLASLEDELRGQLPKIVEYQQGISQLLAEAHEIEKEYRRFDHKKLSRMRDEIEHQRQTIELFNKDLENLGAEEAELFERIDMLEHRKSRLIKDILDAREITSVNHIITENDLSQVRQHYERSCNVGGLRLLKDNEDDDTLEILVTKCLVLTIHRNDLKERKEDAVLFHIKNNKINGYEYIAHFRRGLSAIVKSNQDTNRIIQEITMYWNRVQMLVDVLKETELRFATTIYPIEANEDIESGISCSIDVASKKRRQKIAIKFDIRVRDILQFPFIDDSSIQVKVCFNPLMENEIEGRFKEYLNENGILDLVDGITSLL
ncbi:uncharacterized protein RHIMIDRAFT_86428 [Rhizopus microsporus ATCC 52813]|uniref:Spc7 kinetochore protein domain-containing protein n=1 Tax=Rhizopus microsporus ATCC 52813 TaxID=1340429 RepID=A0A2G4T2L6_RHIZD|nr:uncharacterized protein RHIMIDRAFT_86428 [Rhizopus microsporus ATCC 52813]PHZ15261.1 hypothetical protein RHIMIDRAFT_86428 [Rhizopus microsporus ATCC 52813]